MAKINKNRKTNKYKGIWTNKGKQARTKENNYILANQMWDSPNTPQRTVLAHKTSSVYWIT